MAEKMIYTLAEAVNEDKAIIGGKGYHVAQLKKLKDDLELNFDVPEAYILPTTLWKQYNKNSKKTITYIKEELIPQIIKGLSTKEGFPMVSVRSGAPVSMPGMMDTILNLGINSSNVDMYAKKGNKEWAFDCYTRYLTMYGEIALGIEKKKLHGLRDKKYKSAAEIEAAFDKVYSKEKKALPKDDIETQLLTAIVAVLDSWNNERAQIYRKMNHIDESLGTAIIIQKMVFGNLNDNSATAVVFSRDTNTGSSAMSGEFLVKAQGEDVVSGSATPDDIYDMKEWNEQLFVNIREDLKKLEKHFKDVQDVELTIEDGKMYFLQTRTAKRTPAAALKIAVDMVEDETIEKHEIFSRVSLQEYLSLNNRQVDPGYKIAPDAVGLSASSGVLVGRVVFDLRGTEITEEGEPTILLATETTPDDMPVLKEVSGVVTCVGGVTSHAAVVARSLNKAAIVGSSDIKVVVDKEAKRDTWHAIIGGKRVEENDVLTIDAENGRVWLGDSVPIIDGAENKNLLKIEDMIFDIYPFARAVSEPNDIFCDKNVVYATYRLDTESYTDTKDKLFQAIEIMQDSLPEDYFAIIDLQGKLDFIENTFEETVPFTQSLAKNNFEAKASALLEWSGDKDKFKVYLGKYQSEYEDKFKEYGFEVADKNMLQLKLGQEVEVRDNEKFLTIVDRLSELHLQKPSKNLVISGKNALISLLAKR